LRRWHRFEDFVVGLLSMPGELRLERGFFKSLLPGTNENRELRSDSGVGRMEFRFFNRPNLERNRLDAFAFGRFFGDRIDRILRLPLRILISMEWLVLRGDFLRGHKNRLSDK
jgi:hypothetical protein